MKKLLLVCGVSLLLGAAAQAQTAYVKNEIKNEKQEKKAIDQDIKKDRQVIRKLEGAEVSYFAKQAFDKDFDSVSNVVWKRDGYFDKVAFTQGGQTMEAYYDINANLVGTIMDKSYEDLPLAGRKTIEKRYADYAIGEVLYFDDNENNDMDMILLGTQFEDKDNYFVELSKNDKRIMVKVTPEGMVEYFAAIKI